jgi:hypothetical protein
MLIKEETTRGTCELVEMQTHRAGIAIYALKSTAIELVLPNLVEDIVNLDDSSAVCLHMLVCSSGCYGCAGNLLFIRQSHAVIRGKYVDELTRRGLGRAYYLN